MIVNAIVEAWRNVVVRAERTGVTFALNIERVGSIPSGLRTFRGCWLSTVKACFAHCVESTAANPRRFLLVRPCGSMYHVKHLPVKSLVNHRKSSCHELAVKMEADLGFSRKDGGIAMALKRVVSAERKAFTGA